MSYYSDFIGNNGGIVSLSTTRWKRCYVICLTKPVVFIPDARPVFCIKCVIRHPVVQSPLQHAEVWYSNAMLFLLCLLCVMNVLWMCFECVMKVLWKCYESVMNVLWMCYGCVMDVLQMCYGCVMDVLWMCYGCMRDGWIMDILYLLCKLYCKWYCYCDIVIVLWYNCHVNPCILFFRAFYMTK